MNLFLNRAIGCAEAHRFAKKDETDVLDSDNDVHGLDHGILPEYKIDDGVQRLCVYRGRGFLIH